MKFEKHRLRIFHCHGCGVAVLVQYSLTCQKCGYLNAPGQDIDGNQRCRACGVEVPDWTAAAQLEFMWRERDGVPL